MPNRPERPAPAAPSGGTPCSGPRSGAGVVPADHTERLTVDGHFDADGALDKAVLLADPQGLPKVQFEFADGTRTEALDITRNFGGRPRSVDELVVIRPEDSPIDIAIAVDGAPGDPEIRRLVVTGVADCRQVSVIDPNGRRSEFVERPTTNPVARLVCEPLADGTDRIYVSGGPWAQPFTWLTFDAESAELNDNGPGRPPRSAVDCVMGGG